MWCYSAVDGIVVIASDVLRVSNPRQLYVQLHLDYRYRNEIEDYKGCTFKTTVAVASCELFPHATNPATFNLNEWQVQISVDIKVAAM